MDEGGEHARAGVWVYGWLKKDLVEASTSFLLVLSLRTEEKKPLSARTLPRKPYKLLLATLTNLYQQLDQSEKPMGSRGWRLLLASNLQIEGRVQGPIDLWSD